MAIIQLNQLFLLQNPKDLEYLQQTHNSLVESTKLSISRELLKKIDWNHRMICLKGFRGVGKTTFILDYIKKQHGSDKSVLYLNLNDFYFTRRKLISFADEFSKKGGKVLILDQIQKYPDWSAELRQCYETIPGLKIIFTSSPVMRISEGNPDLNGIVQIFHIEGLSFREFLNYQAKQNFRAYSLDEIIENHAALASEIVSKVRPLAYFSDYLKFGYFPYFIDDPNFYAINLLKNINLALEIDVPYLNQIELKYLSKLRKLLHIIASQTPFTPNISKLASAVETSRATVMNYLRYLKNARLINLLYSDGNGYDDQMKKPVKVYMHNTNLLYAIAPDNVENLNLRHTFFYNQVSCQNEVISSPEADFLINGKYNFIVGGHKIEPRNGNYAASDMIEIGDGKKIPLWLFGFLY